MGLFGPNYTYDELQKKDDMLNSLKKENDRVLREQQRMLDDYNSRQNSKPLYDYVITNEDRAMSKLQLLEKNALNQGAYLLGRIINIDLFKDILLNTLGGLFMMIIISLIINIFSFDIANLFVWGMVICLGFIAIKSLYNFYIKTILISKEIVNTNCYQKIIQDITRENFSDIKCLYVTNLKVGVQDINNKKLEILFSKYNFPNLDISKQGILLGLIIKELYSKDKVYYGFNSNRNGKFKIDLDLYNLADNQSVEFNKQIFDIKSIIYAVNKKTLRKIKYNQKSNNKNSKKEKVNKIKKGESW